MIVVAYQRTQAGAMQRLAERRRTAPKALEAPKVQPVPVAPPVPRQVLRFVPRSPAAVFTWAKPPKPRYLAVEPLPLSTHREVIARVVAWHLGVTVEDVMGKSRRRPVIAAKFDAIAAVYAICRIDGRRYSLSELGRAFGGRDHTSMLSALRRRGDREKR